MRWVLALLLVGAAAPTGAQVPVLERLDRALAVESPGGLFRADLSGLADLEWYYVDQRPPGLVFGGDGDVVNPRLRLFLDARLGAHLYGFVQTRFDRGFDPRAEPDGDARADEYLVRYTPFTAPRLNLQVGKFATVVGNWVPRHDSWRNPFVTAPLPYESVTAVSDQGVPATAAEFLGRRNLPDRKDMWVPLIWGPSYASGAALFGRFGRFDYAAEVKNAALSSRPAVWHGTDRDWDEPTASARLGWRPMAPWAAGVSASSGPYLREEAAAGLGQGQHTRDFLHTLFGADLAYARRRLELWGEFFAARFEVPIVPSGRPPRELDADTAAYYLEARYKLSPAFFAALRWNQQLFGEVEDAAGREVSWDRDIWRVDAGLGYRFDPRLQAKLQYAYTRQTGELQQGEQLVAVQLTVKF